MTSDPMQYSILDENVIDNNIVLCMWAMGFWSIDLCMHVWGGGNVDSVGRCIGNMSLVYNEKPTSDLWTNG
jgi:hypothetical protein